MAIKQEIGGLHYHSENASHLVSETELVQGHLRALRSDVSSLLQNHAVERKLSGTVVVFNAIYNSFYLDERESPKLPTQNEYLVGGTVQPDSEDENPHYILVAASGKDNVEKANEFRVYTIQDTLDVDSHDMLLVNERGSFYVPKSGEPMRPTSIAKTLEWREKVAKLKNAAETSPHALDQNPEDIYKDISLQTV